ncbi:MAG TPA: DUF5916 domain-containing protein [Gemmatimonadaceae bacterium]|nr:DUF5916 domain-containing protein [Gemmatimonadaceae bacterium]
MDVVANAAARPGRVAAFVCMGTASVVLLLGASSAAAAQSIGDSASTPAMAAERARAAHARAPVALATKVERGIRIDGRLEEAQWAEAVPVVAFTQTDPREGMPGTERTEVRLLFTEDALYIGARMWDSSGRISTRLARRDAPLSDSDWFAIQLDTYHDHVTSARFRINPSGSRYDELAGDSSWDPVWEAATSIDADGWTAEMRIPFTQLRFSRADVQTWGIQLSRLIASKQETHVFSFTPRSERGGVARYGHLHGLEGIRSGRPLEVLPYVAGRAELRDVPVSTDAGFANPYRDGRDYFGEVGLDLKYRPTSNLTLDVTVNPDFGQVEVDPAVLNLSANETRLDERRPFFIEGGNIFGFTGTTLLHSRRIGREPQGAFPADAAYTDAPEATTIVGAAKLTGRIGGWNVGILEAVTARETAAYVTMDGEELVTVVEPRSNYMIGRVQRDLRGGSSAVGAIATAVNRSLDTDAMASSLRGSAYTGGVDFRHEWADRSWVLRGALAGSHIRGSPAVMGAAQRASQRYYHRPDAPHLAVDSLATSLGGYTGRLSLQKAAGLNWGGSVTLTATSPGFEVNDLGFQSAADRITGNVSLEYEEQRPGTRFRSWSIRSNGDSRWNFGRQRLDQDASLRFGATLLNYWSGNVTFRYGWWAFDDRFTRGGPLTIDPASRGVDAGFSSDSRLPYTIRGGASYNRDDGGAASFSANLTGGMKPMQSWSLELGPRVSTSHTAAQWVTSRADPDATATYGRRYIFAPLDQTTLSLDTRVNVTFTPALTLGLFAQPFIASGSFADPMELGAPRTFDFLRYGRDIGTLTRNDDGHWTVDPDGDGPSAPFTVPDPDFNRRSLRGSAALRWEWRAGSSLYLVWRQNRFEQLRRDDLDLRRDVGAMFRARAENVLLVKASYWVSL